MTDSTPAIVPTTALEAVARAEIDTQVATAKRYPRDVDQAVARALQMATATPEVAASCFYVLKRKDNRTGKVVTIEGLSIRMAELFACAWGNLAYGFRAIADDGKAVVLEGVCIDYEANLRCTKQVRRNVLDRNGRRLSEDLVTVTTMAAGAIASRNAILGVVPGVYTAQALAAVKQAAVGDAGGFRSRRDKAVSYFAKLGVDAAHVCAAVGKDAVEAITEEDVATLLGLATAIKDGEMTPEQAFPVAHAPAADPEGMSRSEALARELAGGQTPGAKEPTA
jgi:hypothetical protein